MAPPERIPRVLHAGSERCPEITRGTGKGVPGDTHMALPLQHEHSQASMAAKHACLGCFFFLKRVFLFVCSVCRGSGVFFVLFLLVVLNYYLFYCFVLPSLFRSFGGPSSLSPPPTRVVAMIGNKPPARRLSLHARHRCSPTTAPQPWPLPRRGWNLGIPGGSSAGAQPRPALLRQRRLRRRDTAPSPPLALT